MIYLKPTDTMIKQLVKIELGYINTNHPDFIRDTQDLLPSKEEMIEDDELGRRWTVDGRQLLDLFCY